MSTIDERFNYKGRLIPKYKVTIDTDGNEIVTFTKEWVSHLDTLRLKRDLDIAGLGSIPKYGLDTYRGEDIDGNIPRLKKYCNEFKTRYFNVNLYLWSKENGTQKSTCAKDILVRLVKQGIRGKFVLMDDLIHTLLESERDDSSKQKIEVWRNAPFLVIDECFMKGQVTLFSSGYQKAFINTFLKYRLELKQLATCFTANCAIADIGEVWGIGIQSLINRSIPTPMHFNDTLDDSLFRNDDIWK